MKQYLRVLEWHLIEHPPKRSELCELEGNFRIETNSGVGKEAKSKMSSEVSPEEALERIAVSFLVDTFRGRDVLLHMKLLILGGRWRVHLIFFFRLCHKNLYLLVVNLSIWALLCIAFSNDSSAWYELRVTLQVLLAVDAVIWVFFLMMRSMPVRGMDVGRGTILHDCC